MTYADFFAHIAGYPAYPYQRRLGNGAWPEVIDIPTGLGKTAAVVLAWLWKRLQADPHTGRRLVYCLPMRSLVEQTHDVARNWCQAASSRFADAGFQVPQVHMLMGGNVDKGWERTPDAPAILVGTQDILLSRALNRGYGLVPFRWPMHFGLLHSDVLWVLDETQLMGVGVETSAQLEGLRVSLGTFGPARTLWMSATLGREQLETIDHSPGEDGFTTVALEREDHEHPDVVMRSAARKSLAPHPLVLADDDDKYAASLCRDIQQRHARRGGLTLVILNRVSRAQAIYMRLSKLAECPVALVHSRFRQPDRKAHQDLLHAAGDRIVIATQAIEAGVDISAHTLVTELAPWPSMVQRFGRCNRKGEMDNAEIVWIDIDTRSKKDNLALPYSPEELDIARQNLANLDDGGPVTLGGVQYTPPPMIRAVLRRRDLIDLFDTTSDLGGNELDIARYVRDGNDTDVRVYWREIEGAIEELDPGDPALSRPTRAELCNVSFAAFEKFAGRLKKLEAKSPGRPGLAWRWSHVDRRFEHADRARPGQIILLSHTAGGYDPERGWTGEKGDVPVLPPQSTTEQEAYGDDPLTFAPLSPQLDNKPSVWVELSRHLAHVEQEARQFAIGVGLGSHAEHLAEAGRWHDVGKAHHVFQRRLTEAGSPPHAGLWAKSAGQSRATGGRKGFRHELASALAYLSTPNEHNATTHDLIAYLIASHHGKVRLSLRALPGETPPPDGRAFARGVYEGDELPAFTFADGVNLAKTRLSLDLTRLGEGSWLSRMLRLRDDPQLGPFRLAFLEALICAADWRASKKEQEGVYGDA